MSPIIDAATTLQAFGPLGPAILLVIKVTVILLIARLMVLAVPRSSAATKHLAITVALCGVIALPLLSLAIPAWRLPLLPAPALEQVEPRSVTIGSTGDDQEPSALDTAVNVAKAAGVVPEEKLTRFSIALQTIRDSWQGLIVLFFSGISMLLLLRMALGIAGVWTVKRRAEEISDEVSLMELDGAREYLQLEREVHLLRSSLVSVPVVWGLFKPVLLLPAGSIEWTGERLRVVLLHELAHVKRLDGVTLLITKAAVALFWFHPLAWSLERIARGECERACDDLVLASGTRASDYAEHLLQIARALPEADPFRSVTLAMSRRSQLEGRLLSILHPHIRRRTFSLRAVSMVCAVALMVIVPLAAVRLVAAPPEDVVHDAPKGVVEIGPAVAAKIAGAPEMLLAQLEKAKNKLDRKQRFESTPETGSEWYSRGMDLHRSERFPEAIAAFQQSIREGHRVETSTYNIACGYALMGDEGNALRFLRSALDEGFDLDHVLDDSDFDPIRSRAAFQSVIAEYGGKDTRFDSTLRKYQRLQAADSRDAGEWFKVAGDLLRLRRLNESIDAYRRTIALGEKHSTAMYNLACAYSLSGDTGSALEWLQKAVENGFDSKERFENDTDLNSIRRNPRFDDIVALADDLRLDSGWHGRKFFGNLFENDSWKESLPRYEAATRKHPAIGRTWFNLGYAQLQAGDSGGSVRSFQRAAELGYRPSTSMYNTACAYARAGQKDAAFEWLEKARAAGFKLYGYLDDDDDLESLQDDPRFLELRRQVRSEHRERKEKKKHKIEIEIGNVF